MNTKQLGNQVKGIIDDSAARLKDLQGKGKKVAGEVAAKARQQATLGQDALLKGQEAFHKGQKALHELLGEIRPHDLLDRYGKMTVPELIEKLKGSELARHTEVLRAEILGFLKVPQADKVARLEVAVEKLNKEVVALKGLRADVRKLSDQVKAAAAKPVAPKPVAAKPAAPKAPAPKPAAPKARAR